MTDRDEIVPIRPLALHDIALPIVQEYRAWKRPFRVVVSPLAFQGFELREKTDSLLLSLFLGNSVKPIGQGRSLLLETGLPVLGYDLAVQPIRPFRLSFDKGAVVVAELPELERLCIIEAWSDSRAESCDTDRISKMLFRDNEGLASIRSILSFADVGILAEHADKLIKDEGHDRIDDGCACIFLYPTNL